MILIEIGYIDHNIKYEIRWYDYVWAWIVARVINKIHEHQRRRIR